MPEALEQVTQGRGAERAWARDIGLEGGERLGQAGLPEDGKGPGLEGAEVELLGLAVREVEVAGVAGKAARGAERLEAAGAIAGAAILRLIDEALDGEDGMLPTGKPVLAQAAQAQAEDARGEVGKAVAIGEDEEAAVVGDEGEATGALAW